MPVPSTLRAPAVNRLLEALPKTDLRRVLARCETVELVFADVLSTSWQQLRYVYFPTRGFISLIMPIDGPASLEVGLVGDEGMFGVPLALGVDVSPVRAVVQGAGSALRMDAARQRAPCSTPHGSCGLISRQSDRPHRPSPAARRGSDVA